MSIEADLKNADAVLKPGMYASLKIAVEKHTHTLVVPIETLVMEKTAAFVFRAVDGKAKKTPVKLGFQDGVHAEILEGATEADAVILVGKMTFTDGQPVKAEAAQ